MYIHICICSDAGIFKCKHTVNSHMYIHKDRQLYKLHCY